MQVIRAEHWFRKYARTIPVQYLPSAALGAVRNTAFAPGSDEDKVQAIRGIIEIFDEVAAEIEMAIANLQTERKEKEDEANGAQD